MFVEGYTDQLSYRAGDTVRFHVSTSAQAYSLEVARIGAARYLEVIERYGLAGFRAATDAMLDNSERLMRRAIAEVPDGDYSATTYVDGFLDDGEK